MGDLQKRLRAIFRKSVEMPGRELTRAQQAALIRHLDGHERQPPDGKDGEPE